MFRTGEHESFSQKSKLHVLDVERDWLDCDVKKYAAEMSMRHAILTAPVSPQDTFAAALISRLLVALFF